MLVTVLVTNVKSTTSRCHQHHCHHILYRRFWINRIQFQAVDQHGKSILHIAAENLHFKIVTHLIENIANPLDVNILDGNGRNALHSVLIKSSTRPKCLQMVQKLSEYGKGKFHLNIQSVSIINTVDFSAIYSDIPDGQHLFNNR